MKKYLIASLLPLALFLTNATFAALTPEPQVCPSEAAIKAVGVSRNTVQDDDGLWLTGRRNQKYGTQDSWTFVIGKIPASTASEAYDKAAVAMPSLSFQFGPLNGPLGKWVCYYSTAQGYTAVAANPPIADSARMMFVKH